MSAKIIIDVELKPESISQCRPALNYIDGYQARLRIDNQAFSISPILESKEEACWFCDQLKIALKKAGIDYVTDLTNQRKTTK